MKQKLLIAISCLLASLTSCVSPNETKKSKIDSWIHCHPILSTKTHFEEAKEFGKRAKEDGYSTIMIRITNPRGYDKAAAKNLIKYYKDDLGLKVIPEFKLLGKSQNTYGSKFLKEHPELFVGHALDPYATYKGKPAFDSLIIPMIDEHIEIFENPKYFMLGWDEYNTDNIKKIADRNGKTVSDVWAGTLNRVNDYLLSKNITPLIFGDQLMSKKLANKNNPVGYPPDKRFKTFSSVYSILPAGNKTDLIHSVNDIKNKEKIIVLDWHYENETEYPSVDYFKWLGFKEVIPVTWGKDANMKYFSKYAQKRGSKRMMASVWHYLFHEKVRHLLWPTVDNSIVYFNNPNMKIPAKPHIMITKNGKAIISAKPGETITLSISPCGKNVEFDVYPFYKMLRRNVISLKSDSAKVEWKIPANAKEGLWTIQGYSKRKDGYLLHGMLEAGLYIGKTALNEKSIDNGTYISADFSNCIKLGKDKKYILLDGKSETRFGRIEGKAFLNNNALVCQGGGLLAGRSNFDADTLSGKNKSVMVEFMIDKFANKKQEWAGILTWGDFGCGLRIILWHKKLYVQIYGDGNQNARLISKKNLETGQKYLASFSMNDKEATLYLNGILQAKEKINLQNRIPASAPLSIGCSYNGKLWKCFAGKIYRFAIWNKCVNLKTAEK